MALSISSALIEWIKIKYQICIRINNGGREIKNSLIPTAYRKKEALNKWDKKTKRGVNSKKKIGEKIEKVSGRRREKKIRRITTN